MDYSERQNRFPGTPIEQLKEWLELAKKYAPRARPEKFLADLHFIEATPAESQRKRAITSFTEKYGVDPVTWQQPEEAPEPPARPGATHKEEPSVDETSPPSPEEEAELREMLAPEALPQARRREPEEPGTVTPTEPDAFLNGPQAAGRAAGGAMPNMADLYPENQVRRAAGLPDVGTRPSRASEPATVGSDEDDWEGSGEVLGDEVSDEDLEDEALEAYAPRAQPANAKPEETADDVPFQNPDLDSFQREPQEVMVTPPKPSMRRPEVLTQRLSAPQYEQQLEPFLPTLNLMKEDPRVLIRLATGLNPRKLAPYMQMRPYIINHPIKDAANSKVLLTIIDPEHPERTLMRRIPLNEAVDATRNLIDQNFLQSGIDNFDAIIEQQEADREALASLVFILENYAESVERSPFEFHLPKEELSKVVKENMNLILTAIQGQVLGQLGNLRADLRGNMGDVDTILRTHMAQMQDKIADVVSKVMWKIKTDVDQASVEDIKRSILMTLNVRTQSYRLGGVASSIITIMADDLERRFITENFNTSRIKQPRRWSSVELAGVLGYNHEGNVTRAMQRLVTAKLVKMYDDSTIHLLLRQLE